jgi:methionyl-tRNA synthetase
MRGEVSQGMLLSAEFGETVQLITVSENIPNGSLVG